jgi:uncharacterized 2Fe-2S/4Fe-4S cluster protein (DUF4445 family)
MTHTVVFQPSGARGKVEVGTSLRRAAAGLGVEIESICADAATCGKCWVVIEDGDVGRLRSSPDHASAVDPTEEAWLARRADTWIELGVDPARVRLSCQATVHGDMVVFVPESSRGNRQIIRKAATDRPIEIRPALRRYYVTLDPPSLQDPRGDLDRLSEALVAAMARVHAASKWRVPHPDDLQFDLDLIRKVGETLRAGEWKVSVTVWQDRRVIDVRPGFCDELLGVAIDVGSTAIAAYVCDLTTGRIVAADSMMNPQVTYGDDIVSRMKYELEGGLATLHDALVAGVNTLIRRAVRVGGIDRSDVYEVVVVGNTTMLHLLLGLSTEHLGKAPYVPVVNRALDVGATELGLVAGPGANVHVLPAAAGFVGADAMGVILAEEPHRQDGNVLIIDVGTNAELIAGNRDALVCTSTPTGPAFEGAHVEHGMRATVGAIERIEIDAETLEPRYQVIGTESRGPGEGAEAAAGTGGPVKGICGSAIIDGVAEMFRVGIITPRGSFAAGTASDRIRRGDLGWEYVVARAGETSIGRDIPITLEDVRQVQLAKAALYAAARVLLRELGIETPDRIVLAGAFGSRIDTTKAMVLGMIPDCPLDRVFSVGNAAGDGARVALLDRDKRREAQEVARSIRRIELPVDPDFQNEYLQAIHFPHMTHRFASVADLIGSAGS